VNDFIRAVLDAEGSPQEKMMKFFGKLLAYDNAKKYWRGATMLATSIAAQEAGRQGTYKSEEEITFNKDSSRTIKRDIEMTEEEASSPESIMKKLGFNPLLWQVVSCKITKGNWDVTLKLDKTETADGVVTKTTSPSRSTNYKYSIVLTVKPITTKLTDKMLEYAFLDIEIPDVQEYSYTKGGSLLELPIMDFHVGKLSIPEETGSFEYNMEVAETLFKKTVLDILSKVDKYELSIERIIFPVGQDFFHIDTPKGTTSSGTPLEYASNWQTIFSKGVELLVWAIEQLRAVAPVEVMYVPGNHDEMLSYCAVVGLYHTYSATDSVTVDISQTTRKYFSYGNNLVGYSHGREEGRRIAGLMQIEVPELWGESKYREWHLGDLHQEGTKEENGIIIRRISSITAADSWHAKKGYVGAVRKASAYVWDKNNGLELIINSNAILDI